MQSAFVYTRIIGELRKLGIKKISRQTVRNILKEEGITPGPDRTSDSWDEFVKRHAETLWAVDFFSVRTVTKQGLRQMYVMVWLCMTSCSLNFATNSFVNFVSRSCSGERHSTSSGSSRIGGRWLRTMLEQVEVKSYVGGLVTGFVRKAA